MITTPREPDRLQAALVGRLILESTNVETPLLRWRHHKIGVLQAYVVEAVRYYDTEVRIHVWHPSLVLADDDSGRIHDHRFDLRSYVLLGAIHDTEIQTIPLGTFAGDPEQFGGLYEEWEIQNARSAEADGKHWVTPASVHREPYFLRKTHHVYRQGSSYSYPARKFHRSEAFELTVTLCTKDNQQSSPARLLARVGAEPKHAFDPGPKQHGELMHDHRMLLREAADQLLDVGRNWKKP